MVLVTYLTCDSEVQQEMDNGHAYVLEQGMVPIFGILPIFFHFEELFDHFTVVTRLIFLFPIISHQYHVVSSTAI